MLFKFIKISFAVQPRNSLDTCSAGRRFIGWAEGCRKAQPALSLPPGPGRTASLSPLSWCKSEGKTMLKVVSPRHHHWNRNSLQVKGERETLPLSSFPFGLKWSKFQRHRELSLRSRGEYEVASPFGAMGQMFRAMQQARSHSPSLLGHTPGVSGLILLKRVRISWVDPPMRPQAPGYNQAYSHTSLHLNIFTH